MSALACLCHYGETVAIARLDKALQAELRRRAEYAMRFGNESYAAWVEPRPVDHDVVAAAIIYCVC
jgi:hypothetical protein